MADETPESLIPYDEIVQDALRAVVGRVLGEVEQTGGLPGGHHFYITFRTAHPGVLRYSSPRTPSRVISLGQVRSGPVGLLAPWKSTRSRASAASFRMAS